MALQVSAGGALPLLAAALLALLIALSGAVVQKARVEGTPLQSNASSAGSAQAPSSCAQRTAASFPFSTFSVNMAIEWTKWCVSLMLLIVSFRRSRSGTALGSASFSGGRCSLWNILLLLSTDPGIRLQTRDAIRSDIAALWAFAVAPDDAGTTEIEAKSTHEGAGRVASVVDDALEDSAVSDEFNDKDEEHIISFAVIESDYELERRVPSRFNIESSVARAPFWKRNVQFAVPAIFYVLVNNMGFFILKHMTAVDVAMLSNLRILAIALLFRFVLKRQLTNYQWIALVMLLTGVATAKARCSTTCDADGDSIEGILLLFFSIVISSLADIYVEKIFKHGLHDSIHFQNIQLYSYGIVFNGLAHFIMEQSGAPFFRGWSAIVLLIVAIHAGTGLMIGVVLKLADNIVKLFADAAAILLSILFSIPLFGARPSFITLSGAITIVSAMLLFHMERLRALEIAQKH